MHIHCLQYRHTHSLRATGHAWFVGYDCLLANTRPSLALPQANTNTIHSHGTLSISPLCALQLCMYYGPIHYIRHNSNMKFISKCLLLWFLAMSRARTWCPPPAGLKTASTRVFQVADPLCSHSTRLTARQMSALRALRWISSWPPTLSCREREFQREASWWRTR